MHGSPWACSKRMLCCSAFAVLTTIVVCVVPSTTCTTHGCTRQHGELPPSGKGTGRGKRGQAWPTRSTRSAVTGTSVVSASSRRASPVLWDAQRKALQSLVNGAYSMALYGRVGAVNVSQIRILYLSLLPARSLRVLSSGSVGLCLLSTGQTRAPDSKRWSCSRDRSRSGDTRCFSACSSVSTDDLPVQQPSPLLISPYSPVDPVNTAWVRPNALAAMGAIPSHRWAEVTHSSYMATACRNSTCRPGAIWFYYAPGSGVSLNVGNTLIIDEVALLGAPGLESAPRLSRAIVSLKAEPKNALAKHLGLSSSTIMELDTVQRVNHFERNCVQQRQEIVLLLDVAKHGGLSEQTSILEAAATLGSSRVACGAEPDLSPCTKHTAAIGAMVSHGQPLDRRFTKDICDRAASSLAPVVQPRVACLGDSLTRGDGKHETGKSHGPSARVIAGRGNYPLALARMARNWTVANFGRGGSTVSQSSSCNRTSGSYAKASLYDEAVRWRADIYVVMLGVQPWRTPVQRSH